MQQDYDIKLHGKCSGIIIRFYMYKHGGQCHNKISSELVEGLDIMLHCTCSGIIIRIYMYMHGDHNKMLHCTLSRIMIIVTLYIQRYIKYMYILHCIWCEYMIKKRFIVYTAYYEIVSNYDKMNQRHRKEMH